MAALLALSVSAAPLFAQQKIPQLPSLGLAPVDVAFYGAVLRGEEQYEQLMASNAVKKLMTSTFLQLGLSQMKQQMENEPELAKVRAWLEQPENEELFEVLLDGMSEEVFFYGDDSLALSLQMVNRFSGAMRAAQIEMATNGGDEEMMQTRILQFFIDNQESLQVPELVMGLRVSDKSAAARQLERLKELQPLLQDSPLKGSLSTEQIGDVAHLTMTIKGSMLPLEDMEREFEDFDSEEGQQAADKVLKLIRSRTVVLSAGLWNDYLLLSIGPNTDHLEKFGVGRTLSRNPSVRPLAKHINKPLTSVSYLSGKFLKSISNTQGQLEDVAQMVEAGAEFAPISEAMKKALADDAKRLAKEISAMVPEPGDLLGFEYMTEEGYEGYAYNWGESQADASQPLSILNHVGGDPIFFAAGRAKIPEPKPENQEYWAGRLDFYVNNLVMPNLPPEQQAIGKQLLEKMKPLLEKAQTINETLLGPALQGGQSALVFDGKLMSTHPVRALPRPENQLPLPETAVVLGVSDEAKMSEAMTSYFDLGDELIDAARTVFEQIPPFKVPRPIPTPVANTTVYSYPIALLLGIDTAIGPNGAMGNGVAVMSLTPETSSRLVKETPLTASSHISQHADKPLSGAFSLQFPKFLAMAKDWALYGIDVNNPGDESVGVIKDEVKLFVEVLSCLRQISGVSYKEGEAHVTFYQTVIQDLAP